MSLSSTVEEGVSGASFSLDPLPELISPIVEQPTLVEQRRTNQIPKYWNFLMNFHLTSMQ